MSKKTKKQSGHPSECEVPPVPMNGVRNGAWLVWLLLLSGMLATVLAVRHTKAAVDLAAEREFESVCNEIRGKVSDRLSAHEQILRSGAAFFENSGKVSRQEWKSFTERQRVEQQLPGIQGIGFALMIPREKLAQHIQEIRSEGFPSYQVRPEGDREIYSSIIYLEPFTNRNLRAFGYDMLSEPVRRAAMEWARDQNVAALSGKVTLVQETDEDVQAGTLMYVPVYRPGMPHETVAQRRAAIMGWVYSPYRMTDLMHGILGRWDLTHARRIRLEVFDGMQISSATSLYDSQSIGGSPCISTDGLTFQMPIIYADRSWTLVFSKSAASLTAAEYVGVWVAAFAGTVVSLLLAGLLRTLQNTRLEAKRIAEKLTKDLQSTAHRLALAASAGGVGIWDYEVANNELVWDDQMVALYGITREQFSGAYEAWTAGVHPEDRQRGDEEIKMALRGEKEFDTEFRVLWPDGTVHYIRALARVQRDAAGTPIRMVGTNWDITKRRQVEDALRASESQTNQLLQNTDQGIYGIDLNGCCTFINQSGLKILGYRLEDCLGQNMHDLIHHSRSDGSPYPVQDCPIFRAKVTGKGSRVDSEMLWRKDGTSFSAEYSSYPIFKDGEIRGAVVTFSDITERKELGAALSRQKTLLSNLLDSIPDIVFFKDIEGVYLGCNPLFEEFLGRPREKIIGYTDYDLLPKEVADAFRKNDRVMMAQNKARHNEEWITYPDGRRILIDTLKAPLVASDGRVTGMLGVSRDITDRKQAEETLVQQSFLQKILMDIATTYINLPLEEVDQAIQTALKDLGEFVEADRAYIFDYKFTDGICTNTFEWCCDGVSPQIDVLQAVPLAELPDWVAMHHRGDAVYYPDVAALPPGGARDILEPQQIKSLLTIPLVHGDDCLGFVGFDSVRRHHAYSDRERTLLTLFAQMLTNVRLRRRNEDELKETTLLANNLADKANAFAHEKEMFLANMSHEIRTPLNAVLGHAQIMSRECEGCSTKRQSLDAIVKSGEHLLELIDDIMAVIQIDVKDVPLSPSDFDFYNLLNSVQTMSGQRLQGVVPIEIVMAPGLPQFLYADQGKVRQVLLNLAGNAVKFTQRGRVVLSAGFSQTGAENSLLLTVDVEDSGCGIDTDDLEMVFNPFEQTGQKQNMRKGIGLGLPLARRYARALGGDVVILRSVPGQGSTFRFMFKAELSTLSAVEKIECAATVCRVAPDQQAPRILAVDDDATSLQMLASMLKGAGFVVEMADSGACALHLCREGRRFDLILLDKQMPDMDGLETMSRLRKLPDGQSTPIVIVTAGGLRDARKKLLEAGADGYVSKPVGRELLLAEIRKLIGVRYEYDQDVATQDQPVKNLSGLAQVSVEQKKALRQAILLGNVFEMREIVEKIATDHPGVAAGLTRLINDYDYDSLTRWLNPKTGETE